MLDYALQRLRGIAFPPVKITPPPAEAVQECDLEVPKRDGIRLRANVYRPRSSGRYPVLISLHPYGKDHLPRPGRPLLMYRLLRQTGPIEMSAWTGWEAPDPAYWTQRGYVVVNCDMRGFYRSEGEATRMFCDHEG